ncbi:uncharacterized protein LOC121749505 [Salvia splendens]|uniref:uncharacterized protein LOC121749505 n=1 Tax=Salvia splendens TaxID=180675 RepID=UPI001C2565F5|nr:uncharacterized protein LOC121749505 [Salvia splendens]
MAIKWNLPDRPWIKVNTDGAFNAETGKAGGVVWDAEGKLLVAFATPLKAHSALEAELMALQLGLELAKEFERPIWIESDAEQAINLLKGSKWGPTHSCRAMARLTITKRQITFRATFIHREGNKPADLLAKMGLSLENFSRLTRHTAPRLLTAMIRMDEMGIPNVRIREEE